MPAKADAQFTLRSPDRYIIVVDLGDQRSRSKPVELKDFLNKHPKYVMNLGVAQLAGAGEGGGGDFGGRLTGAVVPPPDAPDDADSPDSLYLDFSPEGMTR